MKSEGVQTGHTPVLLEETLNGLSIKPDGRYIDATFGRGGHSRALLARLSSMGQLQALDRDPSAVEAGKALAAEDRRFAIHHANFAELDLVVPAQGWDGILFDFGVSSPQLDEPERGFSFLRDGPLDMRMDPAHGVSAGQWLEQVDEAVLANALFDFGEEKHARRLARALKARVHEKPFTRTAELAEFIAGLVPKTGAQHPATRSFQAIRIAVNDELGAIDRGLLAAEKCLKPGGRLAAISFHSLEDRRVKQFVQTRSRPPVVSRRLPPPDASHLTLIDRDKFLPSAAEIAANPRARSAVLRIAERRL